MSRAALLRAEGGRRGDSLAAASAILARAAAAGRSPTLFERAQLRATVKAHEAETGRSLLAEAEALLGAGDNDACRLRLDVLEALTG